MALTSNFMKNPRIIAVVLIILAVFIGYFGFRGPYKLGLDLNGGTHLVYQADVSKVVSGDTGASMQALRDVIENRINVFGVAEPLVQTETANVNGQRIDKLVVELPGVSDIDKAVAIIGQTPVLDFRVATTTTVGTSTQTSFIPTKLDGSFLSKATVEFDSRTGEPTVSLQFNNAGKDLFAQITKANVGNVVGIFLDNQPISTPVVREAITNGQAQISGNFTPVQARDLVRNLNYGALPVPINLIGSQTIGASLGADAVNKSVKAGIIGFIVIALFLILWYRLPGLVASIALVIYVSLNLALFKLIPVTLTSTGLAAFILSIGMAVDANILIFERKRKLKKVCL